MGLMSLLLGFCAFDGLLPSAQTKEMFLLHPTRAALQVMDSINKVTAHQVDLHHLEKILF